MAEPFLGEVRLFSFDKIPQNWLPCDGRLLLIRQHTALYSLIGNRYGGDGKTTFALPDLQGRVPLHKSDQIAYASIGGEATHSLTTNEMPSHTHEVYADEGVTNKSSPMNNVWGKFDGNPMFSSNVNTQMSSTAMTVTGQSQAHNNMQPFLVVSFCIAINGIYPPRS
ncbi:phage tail protein [Lysinibacillus fusiformis]|uniref:phage tail protein n=1 Tax=Lysinibacillus fusiformis TaxID=28031 RepID=UPI0011A3E152|nr:tail fiber protein [Lysinibacillus fusiformis]